MRSTSLIATLAAAAALGAAGTADAATYCVGSPSGCPADALGKFGALQQGLFAAQSHPGHDKVLIGEGTYQTENGFAYYAGNAANTVEIKGSGQPTVIKADADFKGGEFSVIRLSAPAPSRIDGVKVVVPTAADVAADPVGITLDDEFVSGNVYVTDTGTIALGAKAGIVLEGGSVQGSTVKMNEGADGVRVETQDGVFVADSVIGAGRGVVAPDGGSTMVRRVRITAESVGALTVGGTMAVESSTVKASSTGVGLRSHSDSAGLSTLKASHVTVIGGGGESAGVYASTSDTGDARVQMDNSIIHGFGHSLKRNSTHHSGSGDAIVEGDTNNFDPSANASAGSGHFVTPNTTTLAPGFVDPAKGDWRLVPSSALVNKAREVSIVAITGTDLLGRARTVGAKRDLGAFEYQAAAPKAIVTGAEEVDPGQALGLNGAASFDEDGGDQVTSWQWTFGDGATAAGAQVTHAWSQPGTYEVALTVVDSTGKSSTAKTQVVVRAPDAPVEPPCADCGGPGNGGQNPNGGTGGGTNGGGTNGGGTNGGGTNGGGTNGGGTNPLDRTAPVISALKRRGGSARFSLSEQAKVKVAIQKRGKRAKFRAFGKARTLAGVAGLNKAKLRKLRPGRYRLVVTATDAAGNRGVKRLTFRVK